MHLLHQRGRVGIVRFVEAHRIPSIFAPVLPILDDQIERNVVFAELLDGVYDFVGRVIAFAALDKAKRPFGKHWRSPVSCRYEPMT